MDTPDEQRETIRKVAHIAGVEFPALVIKHGEVLAELRDVHRRLAVTSAQLDRLVQMYVEDGFEPLNPD